MINCTYLGLQLVVHVASPSPFDVEKVEGLATRLCCSVLEGRFINLVMLCELHFESNRMTNTVV